MARLKIKIPKGVKNPRAYIPEELIREGFEGEVDILSDAFTATLIKPNTSWKQIKKSLELMLKDVEMRMLEEAEEQVKREKVKEDKGRQ